MRKTPNSPFATGLSGSAKEAEQRIQNIVQGKKKRPPVILISLVAILVLLCFGLISCELSKERTDPEEAKMQMMDEFLTEVFQFNNRQRYDKLMASSQAANDEEALGQALQEYYQPFLRFVTEDCLNTMQRNRFPSKYDELIVEQGIATRIQDIRYEALDENTYAFEITYETAEIDEVFQTPLKGRISLESAEEQVLVESVRLDSRPKQG